MSQIKVELLDVMGDDLAVVNAARVSFAKQKEVFEEKDIGLVHYLAKHEHTSPFRHNAISLRCKAPVFLARQLGKHQAGLSWNEVSRRYVDADIEFFVPDSWRSRPADGIKQGSGDVHDDSGYFSEQYQYLLNHADSLYQDMINTGVAPEMARMVLPQSMMVDWIWTGNLLSMFHIYRLRSGEGAQLEAKEFAEQLKQAVQPKFPIAWEALEKNAEAH